MSETTAAPRAADEPVSAAAGDVLLTSTTGRVRLLTLNRPRQANAFSWALFLAVAASLRAAAEDDGVGVVVLTGAGKYFSAGADLTELAAQATGAAETPAAGDDAASGPFYVFLDALTTFPKPLLAAVNGAGVGLGLTMLAHCDIVLVSETARLLAPFTTMGVAPEAGSSYLLPRRMGRQQAAKALLAAEWISAAEAVATGLALRSCPPETLLAETLALASTIADKPLASVLATTRLIRETERVGIERARKAEGVAFRELMRRPDLGTEILGRLGPSADGARRA